MFRNLVTRSTSWLGSGRTMQTTRCATFSRNRLRVAQLRLLMRRVDALTGGASTMQALATACSANKVEAAIRGRTSAGVRRSRNAEERPQHGGVGLERRVQTADRRVRNGMGQPTSSRRASGHGGGKLKSTSMDTSDRGNVGHPMQCGKRTSVFGAVLSFMKDHAANLTRGAGGRNDRALGHAAERP